MEDTFLWRTDLFTYLIFMIIFLHRCKVWLGVELFPVDVDICLHSSAHWYFFLHHSSHVASFHSSPPPTHHTCYISFDLPHDIFLSPIVSWTLLINLVSSILFMRPYHLSWSSFSLQFNAFTYNFSLCFILYLLSCFIPYFINFSFLITNFH